jgi:hypothetical protein
MLILSERLKVAFFLSLLLLTVYFFGFEVGAFFEARRYAEREYDRIKREIEDTIAEAEGPHPPKKDED